jgi:hypothetical protein
MSSQQVDHLRGVALFFGQKIVTLLQSFLKPKY